MAREVESWFVCDDGTRLFEVTWELSSTPKAHLVFIHGFSDRSQIQYQLFPTLASEPYNIAVHAIDQRGWGKSVHHPSQRGLTGPTDQVLSDIDQYISHVATTKIQTQTQTNPLNAAPLVLMGHSMGGQEILHYLLAPSSPSTSARQHVKAAILSSPYISLHPKSQPWPSTVFLGRLAARISPNSQLKQALDHKYITHDPAVNAAWRDDPLCHDHGTLEGMRDMLDRADRLVKLSQVPQGKPVPKALGLNRSLSVPVFWAHGTEDRVTSYPASERLFQALEESGGTTSTTMTTTKSVFRAYRGAYHKIHAEPDGIGLAFARELGDWILGVVESPAGNVESTGSVAEGIATGSEVGSRMGSVQGLKAKL